MSLLLGSRPSARTFDVEELVGRVHRGDIRIPHFQRDFRWGWEDVRRLFDSILRGYPVGSLLLWTRSAPAAQIRLGALEIDAPESPNAYWVVDGQQRLTALANALSPESQSDPRFALSYNLRTGELAKPSQAHDAHLVPLPVLFNLQEILKWFAADPQLAEYLDDATAVTRTLRQFEIPAYLVEEDDVEALQDIFDRMNNYGKRLKRAEVFAALTAPPEGSSGVAPLTLDLIGSQIDDEFSFGTIRGNTILGCILARRGPDVRREIRNEFSNPEDEGRDAAYARGANAMRRAVAFLQRDVGVPHVSFLAYQYLLVVLARFFSMESPISDRDRELLARWYWQAALVGPENFRGGSANAAYLLCNRIDLEDPSRSVQQLLDAVRQERIQPPDPHRFRIPQSSTTIILTALWALGPRSPVTGDVYTIADLHDAIGDQTASQAVSYLVPRSLLGRDLRDWAANRILAPGSDVQNSDDSWPFAARPPQWDDPRWKAFLHSHLISPETSRLLALGEIDEVVKRRDRALSEYLESFLADRAQVNRDRTPPIDALVADLDDGDE